MSSDERGVFLKFNVLTDSRIPVLACSGSFETVSVLDLLQRAEEIQSIEHASPLDSFATFRFVLALLYEAQGNPTDAGWPDAWSEESFNMQDFELFGASSRFYQSQEAQKASARKTAGYLLNELPTGTNQNHLLHTRDGEYGLCPNCCFLGLLRLPTFATQGGPGYGPGVNSTPPLYIMRQKRNIAETLSSYWADQKNNFGSPLWSDPDAKRPSMDEKVPILTGLTWVPHSYWLDDSRDLADRCYHCGSDEDSIRCVWRRGKSQGKGGAKPEPEAQGARKLLQWEDPNIAQRRTPEDDLKCIFPVNKLSPSKGQLGQLLTASLESALLHSEGDDSDEKFLLVGFSTNQAKFFDTYSYFVKLPHTIKQAEDEEPQPEGNKNESLTEIKKSRLDDVNIIGYAYKDPKRNRSRGDQVANAISRDVLNAIDGLEISTGTLPNSSLSKRYAAWLDAGVSAAALHPLRKQECRNILKISEELSNSKNDLKKCAKPFVKRFCSLKDGEITKIRKWKNRSLHKEAQAFEMFTGIWWQQHPQTRKTINRDAAWIMMKVMAQHSHSIRPKKKGQKELATLLGSRAKELSNNAANQPMRFRKTFEELLEVHSDHIEPYLYECLSFLRKDQIDQISWPWLLTDVSSWNGKETREKWAQLFLRARFSTPQSKKTEK